MPETLTATTHVGATKLAGHIGAEITGADTGTPLSDEVIAKIRQALLEHKVVFLRGQSLNYRRQVAFAERLGPLTLGHPTLASPPGQPLLEEIDSLKGGKANYWHTDVTFVDRPPAFTLLHAVVIPPAGGDTIWTSIVAAELIAATTGLGYLIMQAGDYLNTALVFSGIIMIAILGLILDACLRGLLLLADPSRRR